MEVQSVNGVLIEADHGSGTSPKDARDEDDVSWSTVKARKRKVEEEPVHQFWNDDGFSMPASRFWHQSRSPSLAAASCQVHDASILANEMTCSCMS